MSSKRIFENKAMKSNILKNNDTIVKSKRNSNQNSFNSQNPLSELALQKKNRESSEKLKKVTKLEFLRQQNKKLKFFLKNNISQTKNLEISKKSFSGSELQLEKNMTNSEIKYFTPQKKLLKNHKQVLENTFSSDFKFEQLKKRNKSMNDLTGMNLNKNFFSLNKFSQKTLKNNSEIIHNIYDVERDNVKKLTFVQNSPIRNSKQIFYRIEKVRDSQAFDEEEFENNLSPPFFYIYPGSKFLGFWELLIFIILIYSMIVDPLLIAFYDTYPRLIKQLNYFISGVYIIDFILNFFVGQYDFEENLIFTYKGLFFNYISNGYFFVDFISGIPIDLITYIYISNNDCSNSINIHNITQFFRLIKLIRLMKLMKIVKFIQNGFEFSQIQSFDNSKIRRVMMFLFYFILFNHISSCFWIFLSNVSTNNWISSNNMSSLTNTEIYIASLYFSLTTIFSIGYGDIVAMNKYERLYNVILMIVGVMIFSFALTSLSSILVSREHKAEKLNKKLEMIEELNIKYKIDGELTQKIIQYFKNDYILNKIDHKAIMGCLRTNTKNDFIREIFKIPLSNLKVFHNLKNDDFKFRLVQTLKKNRVYKGDYLIQEGDKLEVVYFVINGVLRIEKETEYGKMKISELRKNDHFGDVYMNLNISSPINLLVKSPKCDIYIMTKDDFVLLSDEFPKIMKNIVKQSIKTTAKIEMIICHKLDIMKNKLSNNITLKEDNQASGDELYSYEKSDSCNNLKNKEGCKELDIKKSFDHQNNNTDNVLELNSSILVNNDQLTAESFINRLTSKNINKNAKLFTKISEKEHSIPQQNDSNILFIDQENSKGNLDPEETNTVRQIIHNENINNSSNFILKIEKVNHISDSEMLNLNPEDNFNIFNYTKRKNSHESFTQKTMRSHLKSEKLIKSNKTELLNKSNSSSLKIQALSENFKNTDSMDSIIKYGSRSIQKNKSFIDLEKKSRFSKKTANLNFSLQQLRDSPKIINIEEGRHKDRSKKLQFRNFMSKETKFISPHKIRDSKEVELIRKKSNLMYQKIFTNLQSNAALLKDPSNLKFNFSGMMQKTFASHQEEQMKKIDKILSDIKVASKFTKN